MLAPSMGEAFSPDDLGIEVFGRSYAYDESETWNGGSRRVAIHVAAGEDDPTKRHYWEERFYTEIVSNRFMPGGRIWYGSGRPKAQLLNCFVIPISDSREGWGDYLRESLIISGTGGGLGCNFSPVRPNGSEVKGTGGYATGPVSVMRMDDGVGLELVAGGGRRMAKMSALDITHPDVLEFLDCKLEDKKLSTTNISIIINFDNNEFVEKVRNNETIDLVWGGKKHGEISAREIWERIVQNAWNNGEPGVLNGHLANALNNIRYRSSLVCTNPCGEIWLEPYGCCCLGALVLPRFVRDNSLDYDALAETIQASVRFLDNVLTVNQYPLEKIKVNCEDVRRIGLGVMGLHSALLEMGVKYSEGFEIADELFAFIKETAYNASIDLAIEKDPFPAFQPEFLESGFMQNMSPTIRRRVKEHGIRNCALLTVAPTGTTGIVSGVSTGIEPYMAPVYWRRIKTTDERQRTVVEKVLVIEPAYEQYGDLVEGAADISVEHHFEMQKVVQSHVDNAVSKTVNLPNDYDPKDLSELWLKYLPYLKGSTFYRWGSRENEPFEPVLLSNIEEVIQSTPEDKIRRKERTEEQGSMDCVSGICEVPSRNGNGKVDRAWQVFDVFEESFETIAVKS